MIVILIYIYYQKNLHPSLKREDGDLCCITAKECPRTRIALRSCGSETRTSCALRSTADADGASVGNGKCREVLGERTFRVPVAIQHADGSGSISDRSLQEVLEE